MSCALCCCPRPTAQHVCLLTCRLQQCGRVGKAQGRIRRKHSPMNASGRVRALGVQRIKFVFVAVTPGSNAGTHHLSSDMRAVEGIRPMECVGAELRGVRPEPSWFPHTHATPLFPPMRALRTSFGGGGAGSCTALGRGGAVARISPASRPVRALSRNQLCQHKNASTASVDKTVARG